MTLRECQAAEASAAFLKALKKGRAATVYHALYQPCEAPALLAAAQNAAQQWVPPQLLWGRGKLLYSKNVHVPAACCLAVPCVSTCHLALHALSRRQACMDAGVLQPSDRVCVLVYVLQ